MDKFMATRDEILKKSQQRAQEMGLPYRGALLPSEAYELTQLEPNARLVDVRTAAELAFVGRVPDCVEIEWKSYPTMQRNPEFIETLKREVAEDAPVLFLCRSGGRSHEAAMTAAQAGYHDAYNVLEGFEGDCDQQRHRNTLSGWRAAGLPWMQS